MINGSVSYMNFSRLTALTVTRHQGRRNELGIGGGEGVENIARSFFV